MSQYPVKSELKAKLAEKCGDSNLVESIASEFAEKKISCNHRVAQSKSFEVGSKLKSAKEEDIAACAQVLCSFVDESNCSI
jgi:hypothetical protein